MSLPLFPCLAHAQITFGWIHFLTIGLFLFNCILLYWIFYFVEKFIMNLLEQNIVRNLKPADTHKSRKWISCILASVNEGSCTKNIQINASLSRCFGNISDFAEMLRIFEKCENFPPTYQSVFFFFSKYSFTLLTLLCFETQHITRLILPWKKKKRNPGAQHFSSLQHAGQQNMIDSSSIFCTWCAYNICKKVTRAQKNLHPVAGWYNKEHVYGDSKKGEHNCQGAVSCRLGETKISQQSKKTNKKQPDPNCSQNTTIMSIACKYLVQPFG